MISRRDAIQMMAASTAGLLLPISVSRALGATSATGILMRSASKTGEKIPVIGLGSAVTFDVPNTAKKIQPLSELRAAFVKHVGKLVDSSPMYGSAEVVIGDLSAKAHLRYSLFIATKVWTN